MSKVKIPDAIRKVFDEYGFDDSIKLEQAVAVRSKDDWYAILFKYAGSDSFFAVEFNKILIGNKVVWDISSDETGPFESIKEFNTAGTSLRIL